MTQPRPAPSLPSTLATASRAPLHSQDTVCPTAYIAGPATPAVELEPPTVAMAGTITAAKIAVHVWNGNGNGVVWSVQGASCTVDCELC